MAVDTTVAGASAESYASIAESEEYATEVGNTTWGDLSESAQENFLRRATRFIDRYRWADWKYDHATVTAGQPLGQRLQFPRCIDVDGAGDPYLPAEVVECCCAVALALADGASETASEATVKRMKAGTVEIEFETSDGSGATATTVDGTVRDLLGHRMATSARAV